MIKIEIPLSDYEFDALAETLKESGKNLYDELDNMVKAYYEKTVPIALQEEAQRKMQEEEDYEDALFDKRRFAVVHLHSKDEDYYFLAENRFNFFRAACKFKYGEYGETDAAEKYTLDSIAQGMCFKENCDEFIYSVLEKAQEHDERVASVLKIDYESKEMSVREYGGEEERYRFADIEHAICIAEYNPEVHEYRRNTIFKAELDGKNLETELSEPRLKL